MRNPRIEVCVRTLSWLALATHASCTRVEPVGDHGEACTASLRCAAPLVCREGTCIDSPPNDAAAREIGTDATDADVSGCARRCALGTVCNEETGECVQCVIDDHCAVGVCHAQTGACVECRDDSQCPSSGCRKDAGTCR